MVTDHVCLPALRFRTWSRTYYDLVFLVCGRAQQIEVYAEISGMAFTPEGSSFMVSLMGVRHGGFLQYQQRWKV